MNTITAINAFLDAKDGKTESYLKQCRKYLDILPNYIHELPGNPDIIRGILKKSSTLWVKNYIWRIWSSFYHWCRIEYGIDNIMERIEKPQVPEVELRYLTPNELT